MDRYYVPKTVTEAVRMLHDLDGSARAAAGATDLYLDLKSGRRAAEHLVDIRHIATLREIRGENDRIFIGAAVTHTEIENSMLIRSEFPALAKGAGAVGSPQIRNIGTIGGNIVNAQPAADTAVPLIVYDAKAVVTGIEGTKTIPVSELYTGPGRSVIDSTREVVEGFYLSRNVFSVSEFSRFSKRRALCLPMLNVAAALDLDNQIIRRASIAAGPVAEKPKHLITAERLLEGQNIGGASERSELFTAAGNAAGQEAQPRDSLLRGSAEYRKELLGVMVRRILEECIKKSTTK